MIDAVLGTILAQSEPKYWMPPQSSTTAEHVDSVYWFIFWISAFFFALIIGVMVLFVIRYRRRKAGDKGDPTAPHHHTPLELIWSGIPLLLVIVIFYVSFRAYMDMATAPAGTYDINVTAMRWTWQFEYPNGWVDDVLHVPADRPVRLVMTSEDVIHSLSIPDFRVKMDVVPGRYTKTWFRAKEPGKHPLYCTEFCGTGHSDMTTWVRVHEEKDFEAWLEDASSFVDRMPPAEAGELLYKKRGCTQCHSTDGKSGIGPSFKGVFGHKVVFRDGSDLIADENYVRESIFSPHVKVVAGYDNVMPTYKGRLKDKEITAIIAFLKTLKGDQ